LLLIEENTILRKYVLNLIVDNITKVTRFFVFVIQI